MYVCMNIEHAGSSTLVNSGSILIKNSVWARAFLSEWYLRTYIRTLIRIYTRLCIMSGGRSKTESSLATRKCLTCCTKANPSKCLYGIIYVLHYGSVYVCMYVCMCVVPQLSLLSLRCMYCMYLRLNVLCIGYHWY